MIALHVIATLVALAVLVYRWGRADPPRCARSHWQHACRFIGMGACVYELARIGNGGSMEPWQLALSLGCAVALCVTLLDDIPPARQRWR